MSTTLPDWRDGPDRACCADAAADGSESAAASRVARVVPALSSVSRRLPSTCCSSPGSSSGTLAALFAPTAPSCPSALPSCPSALPCCPSALPCRPSALPCCLSTLPCCPSAFPPCVSALLPSCLPALLSLLSVTVRITCPTFTLSPCFTLISPTVPATDDGTSIVALSVSRSWNGCS